MNKQKTIMIALAAGNVIVQNGAVLRVLFGKALQIDFLHNYLNVNSGGGVLIDGGYNGGVIKCPATPC